MLPKTSGKVCSAFLERLERWKTDQVNVQHLRFGTNPGNDTDPTQKIVFQAILEAKIFKPRDIVEFVRDKDNSHSKSSVTKLVRETCDALVSLDILKKDGRLLTL